MQSAQKITVIDFADYENSLRASSLFANLQTDLLSEFLSMSTTIDYKKGDVIYNLNDNADWFYLVIKGWVKLARETMDGDEVIIDVVNNAQVFGENALFDNFIYFSTASVVEATTLLRLPIGLLAEKIEQDPKLAINLLKYTADKASAKSKEIEHNIVQNSPQRIGCFLLRLCDVNAKSQSLNLPFDKTLIASKLGMKPETFSRALAKLKNETQILVIGRTVEIPSIAELSKFCCGACSSQFPCKD